MEIGLITQFIQDPVKAILVIAFLSILYFLYRDHTRDKRDLDDYRESMKEFSQIIKDSAKENKQYSKEISETKTSIAVEILSIKKQLTEIKGEIANYIQSLMIQHDIVQGNIKLSRDEIVKRAEELKDKLDYINQIKTDIKEIYGRVILLEDGAKLNENNILVIKDFANQLKKKRDELKKFK